jgi:hypothetical protein
MCFTVIFVGYHYSFHYATNRQVAGSIPDDVIGIIQWHNPSSCTMALGSTQPLTEMSNRCISWGKGGRCLRLTTYHYPVPLSWNLGTLTPWNPLDHSRPVTWLLYLLHFIITYFLFHLPMYFVISVSESLYHNTLFCLIAALWTRCLSS